MEDSVSNFMTNTFLQKPPASSKHLSRGSFFPLRCGSEREFHIVPPIPCVDDYDQLICVPGLLSFNGSTIVLPDDFGCLDEKLICLRIVPYQTYPGFVKLHVAGDMVYNWDLKKYEFSKATGPGKFLGNICRKEIPKGIHQNRGQFGSQNIGPAFKETMSIGVYDIVPCICCPKWPQEAKEWPTRRRNGEWPLPAIVLEVVRNGCHVVYAQHRDCRDDYLQFRFSFSLAEVILLRTWTTTQQIVYHMLRFFAKRELIQADCPKEKEVLCTYHLKTLMLWSCEEESAEWWKSSSVIAICCKLLRKLLGWIEERLCPNYFIPKANIFSGKIDPIITKSIADKLKLFCDCATLIQWFIGNYLLVYFKNVTEGRAPHEVGEFCTSRIHRALLRKKEQMQLMLFDERFHCVSFGYMNAFFTSNSARIFNEIVIRSEIKVYTNIRKEEFFAVKNTCLRNETSFLYLDSALLMLFTANALSCRRVLNCNDFVSDVLSVVSLGTATSLDWRSYNFPKTHRERLRKSHSCFLVAQEHMRKLCRSGNDPGFQLMSRLSMKYLKKSYINRDSSTCAIQCATVVYMASICFATSQFEAAIDLCSTIVQNKSKPVVTGQILLRGQEEHLNAGCLIFIDDVSNCVGFILLLQYIINTLRPDYRQLILNLRFTPQVFAEYIMIQSAKMLSKQLRMICDEIPIVSLMDSLFTKTVKRNLPNVANCRSRFCVYRRNDQIEEVLNSVTGFSLNEDISIRLLMECSLESMDSFYQQISDRYGVKCDTVVSCYRALYLFKRGQYDNVLSLCDQISEDSNLEDYLRKLSAPQPLFPNNNLCYLTFPNVLALRPFNAYFDEDLHCLIGLQAFCHFSFPERAAPTIRTNILEARFREYTGPRKEIVFNLLLEHTSFVFQYFLGRHFIARYLKLRCFLLCDKKSVSEIFEAFSEVKPHLPFEHVVYQFLLRKLQRNFHD